MVLQPADDDEETEEEYRNRYKGGKGWAVVAVGLTGGVVLDYSPGFGAMAWMIENAGTGNPSLYEVGIECEPDDFGIYYAYLEVWTTSVHDYDGADNDMGFTVVGEWTEIEGWTPAWKPE